MSMRFVLLLLISLPIFLADSIGNGFGAAEASCQYRACEALSESSSPSPTERTSATLLKPSNSRSDSRTMTPSAISAFREPSSKPYLHLRPCLGSMPTCTLTLNFAGFRMSRAPACPSAFSRMPPTLTARSRSTSSTSLSTT